MARAPIATANCKPPEQAQQPVTKGDDSYASPDITQLLQSFAKEYGDEDTPQ
jgi:hypothetical protein